MQNTAHRQRELPVPPISPWSLRAWPPLLWQAGLSSGLRFQHLSTRIARSDGSVAGQTLWGGSAAAGEAGVAWDWIQVSRGVVAMVDPMSVITNLRFVGEEGVVLNALEAARFLNQIVHALPWQSEVARALKSPKQ